MDDESSNQETMAEVGEQFTIEESVLESFSNFYGGLLKEGRAEELEPYIISRSLNQDETDVLGEYETLSYFKGFGAGEHNARSVTVLEADFDGDGKKDILEYDFDNCISGSPGTCSLTLYRMEEDGFSMMYSQPRFDRIGSGVEIDVLAVRYEGEVFLLCKTSNQVTYSETGIYWLRDWEFVGKCSVLSSWKCVKAEEKANDGFSGRKYIYEVLIEDLSAEAGYETYAEKICKDASVIVGSGENWIVSVQWFTVEKSNVGGYFWGSAENCLTEQVMRGEADEGINAFVEKYGNNSGITREKDPQKIYDYWVWNGQMFQSDINNDGEMEIYIKRSGWRDPYDESALLYDMESEGRETDFMDMCGLDIWEEKLIPQMFWIEEADGRNLTFLLYQSADEWSFEIVGYNIDGGQYEEVLKVRGHTVVECTYEYEWKVEGEAGSFPYGVRMAYDDIEHVVLYGMEDGEKQERINREIEEWLREEIETGSLQGHYADREEPASYTLYRATEQELIVNYSIFGMTNQEMNGMERIVGFL